MAITTLPTGHGAEDSASLHAASKTKIIFIALLFILSLIAFVLQTEFTSQTYKLGFNEPILLLFVTHGLWWIIYPIQVLLISVLKLFAKIKLQRSNEAGYERLDSHSQLLEDQVPRPKPISYYRYFKKSIVKQIHNVYHTSILIYESNVNGDRSTENLNMLISKNSRISQTDSIIDCVKSFLGTSSIKYIFLKTFLITIVLTLAGFTWYGAMSMTFPSDVTAIYNCSAFTAYAFAIPLLHEKFSWLKGSSVFIAIFGVFVVAYSDNSNPSDGGEDIYPYRLWGNLLISIGAILYGYYEVLYKKYACIPHHLARSITPRRQIAFANFVMFLLGSYTFIILAVGIIFCQITGIHHFNFFNYGDATGKIWACAIGSLVANILFSASFLSLMALTSPVLSSVSSLVTIFLIGIVEWLIFGIRLSLQQLIGDLLVIAGFVLLTIASWQEISEGRDDDDVETVSTLSFAISTDG